MSKTDKQLESIVPRIMISLPKAVIPDLVLSKEGSPVVRSFVADLIILYAFDTPKNFTMVTEGDLKRLNLAAVKIHEIALTNLRRIIPQPQLHQVAPDVFALTCGGNFEATTLLLDEVWQQAGTMIEGNPVVAVPARDVVAFTSSNNREGLALLRSRTSRLLEVGDHVLTRHFLMRQNNTWIPYTGYAE